MNTQKPGALKVWLFAALCLACALAAIGYTRYAARRFAHHTASPITAFSRQPAPSTPLSEHKPVPSRPKRTSATQMMFRNNALGPAYGTLMVVSLNALDKPRHVEALSCERIAFAGGAGVCLSADRGVITTYQAELFDAGFQRRAALPLAGPPSRARISPDGRLAAVTVFLLGESYADSAMSTQTLLVDMNSGAVLANLEDFTVWRDGQTFKERDFNFWGVTFCRDGNQFYATLATGGKQYLIKGNAKRREARILREGIECPALSPDNTRIAFKKRSTPGVRMGWRLCVLNLASGKETQLSETRSVDDQVEWLDDRQILYGLLETKLAAKASTDIWVLPADGSGPPRKFLPFASSPAVF